MSAHLTILDGRLNKLETNMSNITTVVGSAPQIEATMVGENDEEDEIVVEAWTSTDTIMGEV